MTHSKSSDASDPNPLSMSVTLRNAARLPQAPSAAALAPTAKAEPSAADAVCHHLLRRRAAVGSGSAAAALLPAQARLHLFLSCVYLLSRSTSATTGAGPKTRQVNVGFAASKEDVAARLQQIWLAHGEGHDIASHACGHFDGADWSRADWDTELKSFRSVVENAYAINSIDGEPAGWRQFVDNDIKGFRAPYLSTGKGLYEALADSGFAYDASGISRGPVRPLPDGGIVRFALPQVPEGPSGRRVIAMDYNMFVRHSGGFERVDKDAVFENRAFDAFENAFNAEYQGKRTPLQLGFISR